ncbi:MAG: phosphotransferase [Flavobacteriaceae bacterium]|nr:phosphotransferase [Flavobacteriaceae bacterium]
MDAILNAIAQQNEIELIEFHRLTGGDINEVYLLKCSERDLVVKLNNAELYPGMFEAEAKGLKSLAQTDTFRIPKVIGTGEVEQSSYLLLEYIAVGSKKEDFWFSFGSNLARLHQKTRERFGYDIDNYIGSLPQRNGEGESASEFYIAERLLPQFKIARDSGFRFEPLEPFLSNISEEIPKEPPALIHGDLWNGNYLVDEAGDAVLIDPAVAFAPREMDAGMMHLFGGFPPSVWEGYESIFPMLQGWKNRLPIWQLYYLLVHLNLFGSGYLPQVKSIIRQYS